MRDISEAEVLREIAEVQQEYLAERRALLEGLQKKWGPRKRTLKNLLAAKQAELTQEGPGTHETKGKPHGTP